MLLDEAKKVARVVETAEGGCGGCVNEAVAALNEAFPEFTWALVQPPANPTWPNKFDASIAVVARPKKTPPPVYMRRFC